MRRIRRAKATVSNNGFYLENYMYRVYFRHRLLCVILYICFNINVECVNNMYVVKCYNNSS